MPIWKITNNDRILLRIKTDFDLEAESLPVATAFYAASSSSPSTL